MVKIAYLLSSYPMTSTTFIRREICALESMGTSVMRFAVRHWKEPLIDPKDIEEREKTHYLLTGNIPSLLLVAIRHCIASPLNSLIALLAAFKLWRSAGGFVKHSAYFLQAAYFVVQSKRNKVSHVHAHFATNATAICLLSRLMGGPKYSFTVHGPDELFDARTLGFPIKTKHAEFVVAISHFCKSQILLNAPEMNPGKVKIVHCGLAIHEYDANPILLPRPTTLVCVGRLCPQKSQTIIPVVLSRIIGKYPNIKIILIGDGPERNAIQAQVDKFDLASNISILGWKTNNEVRHIIALSQGLLLPSAAEGLPVVIMEAFAMKRPVITTYIAGIPELVDSTCGWLVPASSEEALMRAIEEWADSDSALLNRKGVEGRRRVELHYDINRSASLLRDLYFGAIADKDSRW
jgi:colanic acid/amylovoran biosynthesis glycosyltransferase